MKDNISWHWLLTIFLIVIVFMLSTKSCQLQDDNVLLLSKQDSAYSIARHYVDKSGQLVNQVKIQELTISQLKQHGDQLGLDNKQLKQEAGALKNIAAYWKARAESKGEIKMVGKDTVILYQDREVKAKTFHYYGKFLSLDNVYNTETDSMMTKYSYRLEFDFITYRRGKTFFKPGQLVGDLRFKDPNLHADMIQGFVIKQEPKKWYETRGFAIGVGAAFGFYLGSK